MVVATRLVLGHMYLIWTHIISTHHPSSINLYYIINLYSNISIYLYIHTLHYITLHCIALHYITLHYITYIHTYIYIYPGLPTPSQTKGFGRTPFVCFPGSLTPWVRPFVPKQINLRWSQPRFLRSRSATCLLYLGSSDQMWHFLTNNAKGANNPNKSDIIWSEIRLTRVLSMIKVLFDLQMRWPDPASHFSRFVVSKRYLANSLGSASRKREPNQAAQSCQVGSWVCHTSWATGLLA